MLLKITNHKIKVSLLQNDGVSGDRIVDLKVRGLSTHGCSQRARGFERDFGGVAVMTMAAVDSGEVAEKVIRESEMKMLL